MGGDHKCSVCQATFTRPQHVARHMRSHTGDRPYKCQFCGDQFARSDLLSRHVNKCHPSEKLPQLAGSTRRKGSAAASRATTSKQSCDQCVQASLPCDGSNPCAKCVQKKCRCTYVKFHRQTAPLGPGHDPMPSSSQVMYTQGERYAPLNMPGDLYHPRIDLPHGIHTGDTQSSSIPNPILDTEISTKYRQADFGNSAVSVPANTQLIPGQSLYVDPRTPHTWADWSQNSMEGFNAVPDESRIGHNPMARYLLDNNNNHLSFSRQFTAVEDPAFPAQKTGSNTAVYSLRRDHLHNTDNVARGHIRRDSHDHSSDSSQPPSSTSSSVHLPPDIPTLPQISYQAYEVYSPPTQSQNHIPNINNRPFPLTGPEGFSSAFGLLSLEDANVLAGLSNDGVPFFSGAGMNLLADDPNATPMSLKNATSSQGNTTQNYSSTSTPGNSRELETRELREFWRAYMRTPLSGPGVPFEATQSATIASQNHTPLPNGPRRARVSSLPSVKTPTVEKQPSHFAPKENSIGNNVTSSIRTTLHHGGGEDLRSYEAAVLARKTPLNLNIVPRKGRGEACLGPQSQNCSYDQTKVTLNESNSSSSLANVFGKQEQRSPRGSHETGRYDENEDQLSRSSLSDQDLLRPSFKRLASQTLGPESSKRAQLYDEEEEEEGDSDMDDSTFITRVAGGHNGSQHTGIRIDRRRRMSAPTTGPSLTRLNAT